MTSGLASIGVTFDSVDLQPSDRTFFLEITQGLNEPPEVRGVDVVVPGLDGQVPRPRRRDRLTIVLTGWIQGQGADQDARRSDFRATAETIRGLFHPAGDPATIQVTLENAAVQENTARPLNVIWNEVIKSEFAYISVELVSVVPSWTVV